jgi:hypothetical protein
LLFAQFRLFLVVGFGREVSAEDLFPSHASGVQQDADSRRLAVRIVLWLYQS